MCYPELDSQEREHTEKENAGIIIWNENTTGINTFPEIKQNCALYLNQSAGITVKSQRELHGNFIHMNWPQQHLKHFTRTERNTPAGQSPKQSTDKSFRTCVTMPILTTTETLTKKCLKRPLNMTPGVITIHPEWSFSSSSFPTTVA